MNLTANILQGIYNAAQPAFEGSLAKGIMAVLVAMFMTVGVHAQTTAAKAPSTINPGCVQFNPKALRVEYLAPYTKEITQESLTQDSLNLVKRINLYNKTQATPNGWDGKPITSEQFYKSVMSSVYDFMLDKVRYYVAKGEIKVRPNSANTNIPKTTAMIIK